MGRASFCTGGFLPQFPHGAQSAEGPGPGVSENNISLLSTDSFSDISVTHGQLQSKNITGKIPEINSS